MLLRYAVNVCKQRHVSKDSEQGGGLDQKLSVFELLALISKHAFAVFSGSVNEINELLEEILKNPLADSEEDRKEAASRFVIGLSPESQLTDQRDELFTLQCFGRMIQFASVSIVAENRTESLALSTRMLECALTSTNSHCCVILTEVRKSNAKNRELEN